MQTKPHLHCSGVSHVFFPRTLRSCRSVRHSSIYIGQVASAAKPLYVLYQLSFSPERGLSSFSVPVRPTRPHARSTAKLHFALAIRSLLRTFRTLINRNFVLPSDNVLSHAPISFVSSFGFWTFDTLPSWRSLSGWITAHLRMIFGPSRCTAYFLLLDFLVVVLSLPPQDPT